MVTTTLNEKDDPIEQVCRENNVRCYRGSVHDVLDRFRIAAKKEKPDIIIRVTGDDPLMDPEIIDKVIREHIEGGFDYSSNMIERTFPRGMDTEAIRYEIRLKILGRQRQIKMIVNMLHFTSEGIRRNSKCTVL